jgi:septum formation protein
MYQTKVSLILASSSPRRRELLARLGLDFIIMASNDEEDPSVTGSPEVVTQEWAGRKALCVAERIGLDGDHWYLGVDTVVVVDDEILGKPGSRDEARSFLKRLSGRWHEVVSGYTIYHPLTRKKLQNAVRSRVKIKKLDPHEIEAYTNTDEPYDKAGAYAVQGIGAFLVEAIEGSYTNVVGLPLTELVEDLSRLELIEAAVKARE